MDNEPLTIKERETVRRLARQHGDTEAAKLLGLSVDSLLRVVADRDIRRGTLHLLREKLAALK